MIKRIILISLFILTYLGSILYLNASLEDIILFTSGHYEDYRTKTIENGDQWTEYWIDRGVREKYKMLINNIGISVLEKATGQKVFLQGPHSYGNINLNAVTDFGHYNPDFLKLLITTLDNLQKDKQFTDFRQYLYTKRFKRLIRTFYEAYNYLNIPQDQKIKFTDITINEIIDIYKRKMSNYEESFFVWENFRPFNDFMDNHGYDWYEANVTSAFWIRRKMDGTDKLFYEIINKLLDTFDKDFKRESIF